jgi:hypothetical protein
MLIVRFLLGSIALTAVWFATWPLESGRLDPMALAIVFSVAVSALASWLSLRSNRRRKAAPFAFAAPFAILALVCVPSLLEDSKRPFLFWGFCALGALILSVFSDALVFRKIVDEEENA